MNCVLLSLRGQWRCSCRVLSAERFIPCLPVNPWTSSVRPDHSSCLSPFSTTCASLSFITTVTKPIFVIIVISIITIVVIVVCSCIYCYYQHCCHPLIIIIIITAIILLHMKLSVDHHWHIIISTSPSAYFNAMRMIMNKNKVIDVHEVYVNYAN